MGKQNHWRDKHVVITGASSGLGRALALYLGQHGATLGILARREVLLEEVAAEVRRHGGTCETQVTDVSDAAQTSAAFQKLETLSGPCDVLIANAGIFLQTDGAQWSGAAAAKIMETNLAGVLHCIDAVLPGMLKRGRGALGVISSIGGLLGLPGAGAYCASKAALNTLCESLRADLRPHNVSVTTLLPGFIDTALLTDEERRTRKDIVSPENAAHQICEAIRKQKRVYGFPLQTFLLARLVSMLPAGLREWLVSMTETMEETD